MDFDKIYGKVKGTKENPYKNFGEAMKDGQEGRDVYVGDMLTKMEYAKDDAPSTAKTEEDGSSWWGDNSSSVIKDIATGFLFPPSIPFTAMKYLFGSGGKDGEGKKGGLFSLNDKDDDGSPYTSSTGRGEDRVTKNWFGQTLNMGDDREITGFWDSLDVDGDGSWLTSDNSFFTPQTPEQQQAFLEHARNSSDNGGTLNQGIVQDPNAVGVLPDGSLKCKEGFYYDLSKKMCVKMEETASVDTASTNLGITSINNPLTYGQDSGGEQILTTALARNGIATEKLPLHPTGRVAGAGGPRDDMVGPIMLSNREFVMPETQIIDEGNGSYEKGIKSLEQKRKASLKKHGYA